MLMNCQHYPLTIQRKGGLGVIGGVGYTPQMLKDMIDELKVSKHDLLLHCRPHIQHNVSIDDFKNCQ